MHIKFNSTSLTDISYLCLNKDLGYMSSTACCFSMARMVGFK